MTRLRSQAEHAWFRFKAENAPPAKRNASAKRSKPDALAKLPGEILELVLDKRYLPATGHYRAVNRDFQSRVTLHTPKPDPVMCSFWRPNDSMHALQMMMRGDRECSETELMYQFDRLIKFIRYGMAFNSRETASMIDDYAARVRDGQGEGDAMGMVAQERLQHLSIQNDSEDYYSRMLLYAVLSMPLVHTFVHDFVTTRKGLEGKEKHVQIQTGPFQTVLQTKVQVYVEILKQAVPYSVGPAFSSWPEERRNMWNRQLMSLSLGSTLNNDTDVLGSIDWNPLDMLRIAGLQLQSGCVAVDEFRENNASFISQLSPILKDVAPRPTSWKARSGARW